MIRWPGMQCVGERFIKGTDLGAWVGIRNWTVVQRDFDSAVVWLAPRWIGWLYRLLPNHFNVNLTGWKTEPSMYLANVAAPSWGVGIVIRKGIPAIHCWFGHWNGTYLPWGGRLYRRLVK